MSKHVLDTASAKSDSLKKAALRIEREARPSKASLELQQRSHATKAAKRVERYVEIDRGKQA